MHLGRARDLFEWRILRVHQLSLVMYSAAPLQTRSRLRKSMRM